MISRSLRRGRDIYAAFLLLTLACAIMVYFAGRDHLADESNTRILLEHPGATLAHAAILQYRPVNTDVLPVFVIYHVFFAPLLWLLLRAPSLTLGASLLLYALVHVFGWSVPAWPNNVWFFNPLAWQLLIVLGAWCVIDGKKFRLGVTSRTALVLAVLYMVFSLIITLSSSTKLLEPLVPQTLTSLLFLLDKSNLGPLRLLHFFALAILAVWFVPHKWGGLMTPVMRGAMRCGQNSLPIYCFGVLLALASHVALLDISDGLAMQMALSLGGILAMIVAAMLLHSIRIKPGQQPRRDGTLENDDFRFARSRNFEGVDTFFGREGSENCANPHMDGSPVAATSESRDTPNSQRAQLVLTAYFSALKPRKRLKVVESDTAPKSHIAGLVRAAKEGDEREPLGHRIGELPDGLTQFEGRDPRSTFTV